MSFSKSSRSARPPLASQLRSSYFVPRRWLPFLVDFDAWAAKGLNYLRDDVRAAVATAATIFVVALGIAYVIYTIQRLRQPAEFRPQGSVWVHSLGSRPKGKIPWVGVQLDDGRLIEGLLHSYSLAEDETEQRDIALQRPIRITMEQGLPPQDLPHLNRIIVPDRKIDYIAVVHAPERKDARSRSRWRRTPATD